MPRLSDSMEEGTILRWLKADGDDVRRGEELVEIETDKATMTYEADQDGVLEIIAAEGATLAIGEVIAQHRRGQRPERRRSRGGGGGADEVEVEEPDMPVAGPPGERGAATATTQDAPVPAPSASAPAAAPERSERLKASPVARRIAREHGVDLAALNGSGPGGRIVKADVEAAATPGAAPAAAPPGAGRRAGRAAPAGAPADVATAKGEVRVQELTRTQQVIARRMAEAKATVPEFTLQAEVDMDAAVRAREELKAMAGQDAVVPSYNDMIVKASALALREFPRANGAYRDGHFELFSRVNVGVAVAGEARWSSRRVRRRRQGPRGDRAETRALAGRVRDGSITPPGAVRRHVHGLQPRDVRHQHFTAVINPPQAAILAVGALVERPVVRDGAVVAGHVMPVTLACDHRILYGAEAAEFLGRLRALLEHPAALAL